MSEVARFTFEPFTLVIHREGAVELTSHLNGQFLLIEHYHDGWAVNTQVNPEPLPPPVKVMRRPRHY